MVFVINYRSAFTTSIASTPTTRLINVFTVESDRTCRLPNLLAGHRERPRADRRAHFGEQLCQHGRRLGRQLRAVAQCRSLPGDGGKRRPRKCTTPDAPRTPPVQRGVGAHFQPFLWERTMIRYTAGARKSRVHGANDLTHRGVARHTGSQG